MKTVYIPRGETVSYEALTTEKLVVMGELTVLGELKAKSISGTGVISAGAVRAETVVAGDIEAGTIICRKLAAKIVSAAEVIASESAAVSCFLSTAYMETPKLTVAASEISEIKAGEVINLTAKHRGLLMTLLLSALRSLWLFFTTPLEEEEDDEEEIKGEIAETVNEIMNEKKNAESDDDDFELQRMVSTFKLLRDSGYTLRVIPGTPEENAPKVTSITRRAA